jgi:hypothetical protein
VKSKRMRRSRQSELAAQHVPRDEACQETMFRSGISSNARRRVERRREAVHEKVLELHWRREAARRRGKRMIRAGRRDGVQRRSRIRARGSAARVAQGLGVKAAAVARGGGAERGGGWREEAIERLIKFWSCYLAKLFRHLRERTVLFPFSHLCSYLY